MWHHSQAASPVMWPSREPTATFVRPAVGHQEGSPSTHGSPQCIRIAVETTGIRKTHTIHTTHTDRVTQGKNPAGYWVASIPAHTGPRGASRARMASYCHLTAEARPQGR